MAETFISRCACTEKREEHVKVKRRYLLERTGRRYLADTYEEVNAWQKLKSSRYLSFVLRARDNTPLRTIHLSVPHHHVQHIQRNLKGAISS